ncbi:MAG TPA: hypothetical protein VG488_10925 [Candidatus Angelobacter sp.]|nr:hypothetical protein [Candidatus Angelobacter sp.]
MKLSTLFVALTGLIVLVTTESVSQTGCEFNITGMWESASPDKMNKILYQFSPDGFVKVFSPAVSSQGSDMREIARGTYKLDDPKTPKAIEFRPVPKHGQFPWGSARLEITKHENTTFTSIKPGSEPMDWTRVDPHQYFVVFAARRGTPQDGGPAFTMLIKTDAASQIGIKTFGLYYDNASRVTGPVPAELYTQFMTEPGADSDVMLRIKISKDEFERSMTIMQNWQRRARAGELLFPSRSYLNSIVPMKEIAESLDQCNETIKLHQLNWKVDDEIGANYGLSEVSFRYVKKLRELNEVLHVKDGRFQQITSGRLEVVEPRK